MAAIFWSFSFIHTEGTCANAMVPTETGKQEGIFQSGKSQGILSRLEKSGNFTQNTGKIKKKIVLEN